MRTGSLRGVCRCLAGGRVLALAVVAGLVTALVVGASSGMASASVTAHRPLRPEARPAGGAGLSLAQAPAGLRAAVRKTPGPWAADAGSAFEQAKLTDPGGAANDQFGYSVAITGSTAVVGAPGNNSFTGAAYVFTRSGSTWSQKATLADPGAAAFDYFGGSVAISGSTVVVGADEGGNSQIGAAYVFVGSGSTWSQQATLTAAGGASGDLFGAAVAISGSTVVVGAYGSSSFTGAAYVFARSGTTWSQQAKLTTADGVANDNFGGSVAISGSTAVVGAYGHNAKTGAAYVFARSGTTWSQQAELTPADGVVGDSFGGSVAIAGSTAVVGADGTTSATGAAYVFARSGTTWSQQAELTAAGSAAGDDFGRSVAIAGSTAVVGADGTTSATGTAYVFTSSGSTWSQQAELTAAGGAAGDHFGWSVAIAGSTAVAGAYAANSDTGTAYAFVLPSQQAKLAPSNRSLSEAFGASVAISGSTAVVGAQDKNSQKGAAYVFVRSGTKWSQQAELTASNAVASDEFGYSVAISGSTVVVGAPYKGATRKTTSEGVAYVFVRSGTTWSQQAELTASNAATFDQFGFSVATSGSTAVIGANGKTGSTGAAYVFVRSGTTWSQQAELTAAGGAAGDGFGRSVAIAGSTAVIGANGSNSGSGTAYVFVRSGTTWSQQAELTAAGAAAFGDSVAIAGSTAVVGADGTNSGSGTAYVFVRSGTTWSQQAELTAAGGASGDAFGWSVAIAGSTAVISADNTNSGSGTAYVFVRSGTTWSQQAELTAVGVPSDEFGYSVAISGSTAVVGAPFSNSDYGTAYAFVNV